MLLELLPISFTYVSLAKVVLIVGINMLLGYAWYSPIGFRKQWIQLIQRRESDECNNKAIWMSNIGTLLNSFLLNILLIAFDVRHDQFPSAILASAILSGFYAFNGWNYVFFTNNTDYKRRRTLYLIDIGFTFALYTLISLVLVSF